MGRAPPVTREVRSQAPSERGRRRCRFGEDPERSGRDRTGDGRAVDGPPAGCGVGAGRGPSPGVADGCAGVQWRSLPAWGRCGDSTEVAPRARRVLGKVGRTWRPGDRAGRAEPRPQAQGDSEKLRNSFGRRVKGMWGERTPAPPSPGPGEASETSSTSSPRLSHPAAALVPAQAAAPPGSTFAIPVLQGGGPQTCPRARPFSTVSVRCAPRVRSSCLNADASAQGLSQVSEGK